MTNISVGIDVPDMDQGVRFYTEAFGFSKLSEPYPGVVVLKAANIHIALLERRPQTKPSPNAKNDRDYDRHWTPVHLDIHVDNLETALNKALKARAKESIERIERGDNVEGGLSKQQIDITAVLIEAGWTQSQGPPKTPQHTFRR